MDGLIVMMVMPDLYGYSRPIIDAFTEILTTLLTGMGRAALAGIAVFLALGLVQRGVSSLLGKQ